MLNVDPGQVDIQVMGILNSTPDSFYPNSRIHSTQQVITAAATMVKHGATILDVGGESTRPGATAVSVDEECGRIIPMIEAVRSRFDVLISVDTSKPTVMQQAIAAGAGMVNDVRALQLPGALDAVANADVKIALMHMQGEPEMMQKKPVYKDLIADITAFFQQRIKACESAGIKRERLILDPGFGFGKTVAHNLSLINHFSVWHMFSLPLLIGVSRKSTIGVLLGDLQRDRLVGSLALTLLALQQGATLIRTHDVQATQDVVKMYQACQQAL
jgi:dihydropteroate synthase